MHSRGARSLRGLFAGVWATVTAAASHTLAGGTVPPLPIMAVAIAFAVLVSIALTGARLNVIRLACAVGISQLAFHGVFSALGGGVVSSAGGPHNHGPLSFSLSPTAGHHDHGSVAMLALHAVAAAFTFVVFHYGESAFWGMRTAASSALARILAPLRDASTRPVARHARVRIEAPRRIPFVASSFVRTHGRRGPPRAFGIA
jgi:hypothetical protein